MLKNILGLIISLLPALIRKSYAHYTDADDYDDIDDAEYESDVGENSDNNQFEKFFSDRNAPIVVPDFGPDLGDENLNDDNDFEIDFLD